MKGELFSKYKGSFSTPIVGLEIGSSAVKMVEIEKNQQGIKINWAAVKEVPSGSRGEAWRNQVAGIIRNILHEKRRSPRKVYAAISGRNVAVKPLLIADMPRKELDEAVRWELAEKLPFSVETANVDYKIIREFKKRGVKKLELIVGAAEKELLDELLGIAKAADITIAGIAVAPISILNLVTSAGMITSEKGCVLVDIGAEMTSILVIDEGKLVLARSVPVAGRDITKSMTSALTSDKGQLMLDFTRAERIKLDYGFPLEEQQGERADKIELSLVASAMRTILEQIAREIKRSADYVAREGVVIDQIILSGGGSKLKNISVFLAKETGIDKVRSIDVEMAMKNMTINRASCSEEELAIHMPRLTAALGAALGMENQVDLLFQGPMAKRTAGIVRILQPYTVPAAITIVILAAVPPFLKVAIYEPKLNRLRQQVEAFGSTIDELKKVETEYRQLMKLRLLYNKLLAGGIDVAYMLLEISDDIPDNVVLTYVKAGVTDGKKSVDISGFVEADEKSESVLAHFMINMAESDSFRDVRLISTKKTPKGAEIELHFKISAKVS